MEIERQPAKSYGDKHRTACAQWIGIPSGLTPELASKVMLGLHGGKTIRDLTCNGDDHICSMERFNKHCELNPEWGSEARLLSKKNSDKKKSVFHWKRGKTFEFCRSGRHRMEGDNVIQSKRPTNRFCRACRDEKRDIPLTCEEIEAVKRAVSVERRTLNNITRGVPIGGGKPDYSKAIVYSGRLYAQFKRDPELHSFVRQHIAGNVTRGQIIRRTKLQTAVTRNARNDYHNIRDMIRPAILTATTSWRAFSKIC
jgi:hypothetical protein